MLRLSRLVWVVLLACAFTVFSNDHAQADTALASYYGAELAGQPTASGEPFDPYAYTAAHKTLPLGTQLMVNYGGRSVQVTVNDRGPYVGGRDLDLSQGAAQYLGLTRAGVDYVNYNVVGGGGYNGGYSSGGAGYARSSESYSSSTYAGAQQGGTYVVQPGETLSSIAAELGTSVAHLAAANGIANPNLVYAGQTLQY